MDKASFGNFLKNARESAEMTQKELAKKAGFSDRAISMRENGTREFLCTMLTDC